MVPLFRVFEKILQIINLSLVYYSLEVEMQLLQLIIPSQNVYVRLTESGDLKTTKMVMFRMMLEQNFLFL